MPTILALVEGDILFYGLLIVLGLGYEAACMNQITNMGSVIKSPSPL